MRNKVVSLIVASLLVVGSLAGCGGSTGAGSSAASKSSAAGSSAAGSSAAASSAAATGKTFTVGFDKDFPPYGFVADNGEFTGFDMRTWLDNNADWENDISDVFRKHLEDNDLIKYLTW